MGIFAKNCQGIGARMAACDWTCGPSGSATKMLQCCKQHGWKLGGCPDGQTVWCTNDGDTEGCPPKRTPQCDVTCHRSSTEMIQCCKANGFRSGGCPNGDKVYCTF
uniref:Uncharacterized protein n=1 Tax=Panagrolaimus davidi TaxID=227884 RepID=A0A914PPR5_9BILA